MERTSFLQIIAGRARLNFPQVFKDPCFLSSLVCMVFASSERPKFIDVITGARTDRAIRAGFSAAGSFLIIPLVNSFTFHLRLVVSAANVNNW